MHVHWKPGKGRKENQSNSFCFSYMCRCMSSRQVLRNAKIDHINPCQLLGWVFKYPLPVESSISTVHPLKLKRCLILPLSFAYPMAAVLYCRHHLSFGVFFTESWKIQRRSEKTENPSGQEKRLAPPLTL